MHALRTIVLLSALLALSGGCESLYYGTWEKLGYQKRDLLVDSVEEARDGQQQAKQQFESAFEQFASIVEVQGGELEQKYEKLASELNASERRAEQVSARIDQVEDISEDLFAEWESELERYNNEELRKASDRQLRDTRQQYERLIDTMRRAEAKMDPVLAVFRDQVLFLKHNLNARAIASLQSTTDELRNDVAGLMSDMQASIEEANAFLESLDQP